jgi:hypothetical protein
MKIKNPRKRVNWKHKLWDAYSLYRRKKANGVCEFHKKLQEKGIPAPCVCNGVIQACHKIGRSKIFIDNRGVFPGCSGSNAWSHYHELEWDKLWRKLWPEDEEYLESIKHVTKHYDSWTCKVLIEQYKKLTEEL